MRHMNMAFGAGPMGGSHGGPGDGSHGHGPHGMRGGHRGGRGGRGGRPRGDIRLAVLALLAEQSRHGYELMKAIEERTSGTWAPSPGSVYPTLQALEDEGLVTVTVVDGRKMASLTDAGRAWTDNAGDDLEKVFDIADDASGPHAVRKEMLALTDAAHHVMRTSGAGYSAQVVAILSGARKDIYRLLAEAEL